MNSGILTPMYEKSAVVIPTYNEKDCIETLLATVRTKYPALRIVVVDDNSPDGTGNMVDSLARRFGGITLISRPKKRGIASAYTAAFTEILKSRSIEYLLTMDADFSHNPDDIPRLLAALEKGNDLAIGSRYVKNGRTENWGLWRRVLSICGNLYARIIAGVPMKDLTTGFVAYRRRIIEHILAKGIRHQGYVCQVEMKFLAHKIGAKLAEVPIIFRERERGTSKMSGAIIAEGIAAPWRLRFRRQFGGARVVQ